MRLALVSCCCVAFAVCVSAQRNIAPGLKAKPAMSQENADTPEGSRDLPVRRVVLYKNGVGYFEHAGTVTGNQHVAVDFTSAQLNDALQSLTVLDDGGGRIAGVNYNSTTPVEQQLRTLALGLTDYPATVAIYQALRGQRVEVSGAGTTISGRLVNIEFHSVTDKNGQTSQDHYYLVLTTDSGALRTAELTDALSVRMLDPALQKQFASYLEIVASAQNQQVRHLLLEDRGDGARQLRVSYISEVPVWKATYRMVFPRAASGESATAIVQGWAVVDNTVGSDWDNVQLSLVAGAPQSFIQPLSQPIYTRRPEIPIAVDAQSTPQTHEAAEAGGKGGLTGTVTDTTGAVISGAQISITSGSGMTVATTRTEENGTFSVASLEPGMYTITVQANGFQRYLQRNVQVAGGIASNVNASLQVGSATETVEVSSAALGALSTGGPMLRAGAPQLAIKNRMIGAGVGGGFGGGYYRGGVDRASDAIAQGDVSTNAFDDFFQYAITQPVTIHKNESAMVPILQESLPAEHVTLWNETERRPLRAVWLNNTSKLTLDSGSFSIFESGEFAGEGLLDTIHPGERRLVSYATDTAIKVRYGNLDGARTLRHIAIHNGVVIETTSAITNRSYTVTNAADEARTVIIEHTRQPGAELISESNPAETTATAYRFRITVAPHESTELKVSERANLAERVDLNPDQLNTEYIINVSRYTPELEQKLRPLIDAETALSDLNRKLAENEQKEKTLTADEARDRDNVTALKGNEAGRRFVDELYRAEDDLQATRKEHSSMEQQRDAARAKLEAEISKVSFETDLSVVMQGAGAQK